MNKEIKWYKGTVYVQAITGLFKKVAFSDSFSDWKSRFTYIHGEFDSQRKIRIDKLLQGFGIDSVANVDNLFRLLYCLETYYSIVLRIIAYKAVFSGNCYTRDLFNDHIYQQLGISNYKCIGYYDWFLEHKELDPVIRVVFDSIDLSDIDYEGDAISTAFENIFPKEIRHSLGEFYTPYWLAKIIIDEVTGNDMVAHNKLYLDPTCGSGTFIIALINKYKQSSKNSIFKNVCGIDINPLTVLAAKTNYLLLYCQEYAITESVQMEIPIYCADTIAINDVSFNLFEDTVEYDDVPRLKFDYIVGNPPWVNWEYLPNSYRMKHIQLWQYYGLFSRQGLNTNFIKEDISVLITYVVIDNYLAIGGKLGFIVKESLFKSIRQGEGFRKFRLSHNGIDLCVNRVDDLTGIKPFKDAVTRAAIIYLSKGKRTVYPVSYCVWIPKKKKGIFENNSIIDFNNTIEIKQLNAHPSVKAEINSGWITESEEDMQFSRTILGHNDLVARTGVFTGGANGIFWLKINNIVNGNLLVSNITEKAKNKMKKVKAEIEKEYIFPFLTGNELKFWAYSYSKYILCPHTSETRMFPISHKTLMNYPLTANYFLQFKSELENRKGFTSMDKSIHDQFFYTLQRIGTYTFARYKVCWRYISKSFTPAVVEYTDDPYLGEKSIIGNEKIISIAFDNGDEAYYLCGVISSTPYRKTIENYMVGTQITPSIINRLNIPKYDVTNREHQLISQLCRDGHKEQGSKESFVKRIDEIIYSWL